MTHSVTKAPAAVLDASWVIGICAKESNKFYAAKAKLDEYARDGWELFAPGILIGEVLYVLCNKLLAGDLDVPAHSAAIAAFDALMSDVKPPPTGDASLIAPADAIRGTYGCSKANDAIYLALAKSLRADRPTELVTFDAKLVNHAKANGLDDILVTLPVTPPVPKP